MSTLTLPARPGSDRLWPKWLERLFLANPRRSLAVCAACVVALAVADFVTPVQLDLTFAYVCVLIFACWHGGTRWGIGFAMAAFLIQLNLLERGADAWGMYSQITLANRLFSFLIVVALMATVRNLFNMLQAYAGRLQAMSRHLVHVQELERRRLSGELHDCAGQHLMAVGINLDIVDNELREDPREAVRSRLADARAYVGEVCDWVRSALEELRPTVLDALGLVPALQEHTRNLPRYASFSASLRVQGEPRPLGHDTDLALFRIVQESLANAARHSGATQAIVSVDYQPGRVTLMVADGGKGFEVVPDRRGRPRGFGLLVMQERASAIGARFEIDSSPGGGTRVSVEVLR